MPLGVPATSEVSTSRFEPKKIFRPTQENFPTSFFSKKKVYPKMGSNVQLVCITAVKTMEIAPKTHKTR